MLKERRLKEEVFLRGLRKESVLFGRLKESVLLFGHELFYH